MLCCGHIFFLIGCAIQWFKALDAICRLGNRGAKRAADFLWATQLLMQAHKRVVWSFIVPVSNRSGQICSAEQHAETRPCCVAPEVSVALTTCTLHLQAIHIGRNTEYYGMYVTYIRFSDTLKRPHSVRLKVQQCPMTTEQLCIVP